MEDSKGEMEGWANVLKDEEKREGARNEGEKSIYLKQGKNSMY